MAKYIKDFTTHTEYESYIESSDAVLPNVSYCEDLCETHYTSLAPMAMKLTYIGNNSSTVNLFLKNMSAFGDTYTLDLNSIERMTLDGQEVTVDDFTLTNRASNYSQTCNIYTYVFGDTNEHELIIYSWTSESLRFSSWRSGPSAPSYTYFSHLIGVEFGEHINTIGAYYFDRTAITSLVIPSNINLICERAFQYCQSLTTIDIQSKNITIHDYAFEFSPRITSITIGYGTFGEGLFVACSNLLTINCTSLIEPEIISSTFAGMSSGGTLNVPSGSDYSTWMSTSSSYLGYFGWTKVEV